MTATLDTPADGTGLIQIDPMLGPYAQQLRDRHAHYRWMRRKIDETGGLLGTVSQGHRYFGFNRGELYERPGVWYREWAPAALQLRLIGDFNGWDRMAHPLVRDQFGVWSLFVPDDDRAGPRIPHASRVKVHVVAEDGSSLDRIPAYIRRAIQDPPDQGQFTGQYWDPPKPYAFQHKSPKLEGGLRVYESHVGMSSEHLKVATYDEFTATVLPRVKKLGYNAVQLMAVQEHPYYGSFGYHVSSFFAPSSRFGTPEELKRLIDTAHGMGLLVIMDIVHSHAVKNVHDGLNLFDGTDYQYFHAGGRGDHPAWDSKLFDYSKFEVQRFLLSNCRYWVEEFRFDGFRFDGVTSMMYHDHGLGKAFARYDDYFDGNVDKDAVGYLQLANDMLHELRPETITIAEDVSGMVGMARPVREGGIGFDYRLAMGVPDYWVKLIKERKDEHWNLGELFGAMLNRRFGEKHVGYAESHDQALVGDKTIAFRLMDAAMYWQMSVDAQSHVIDRGVALHKMIRLITFSLAGEGWLNFMGNEFGHPEWIDFPRAGNNWSYYYARRQWSLADNEALRYAGLNRFDAAMNRLDVDYRILIDPLIEQLHVHEDDKQLVYRRGPLVFVFNFHPTNSYGDWRIGVPDRTDYRLILNTDSPNFSGHGSAADEMTFPMQDVAWHGRKQSVMIYVPSRSAQVLAPANLPKS